MKKMMMMVGLWFVTSFAASAAPFEQKTDGRLIFKDDKPQASYSWDFKAIRWGMYDVVLQYGVGKGVKGEVEDTGHFQNFKARKIGLVKMNTKGIHQLAIKPLKKKKNAVMDIREIHLLPVQ